MLLLLTFVASALAACDGGAPQISLETARLELGDVPNGEIVTREINVRNDGDATLVVAGLSTSCG